jgi:chlorobactene glucosyltransferase
LIFCAALWLILLGNVFGMRRLGRRSAIPQEPFISVLVPARNESVNIEACVRSLLAQDYEHFELLVLDDASTDETAKILTRLAAESPRLQVLHSAPLPENWLGKNWACHQLAQVARGEFLLFLDADTRAHPALLRDVAALASQTGLEYFSGVPRQEAVTLAERLVVPMVPWIAHNLTPIPLVRRLPLSFLATAIGQCMFFQREVYAKIGGHAAVRSAIVEDFALARRAKRLGLRWDLVYVSPRLTTRMYHTLAEAWDGFSKSLFGAFNYNPLVFAFVWAWTLLAFWQPWIGLALSLAGHPLAGFSPSLAILTILLQMGLWAVTALRFRSSLLQILVHPLTIAFFAGVAARSAWRHYRRRPLEWKGRQPPVKK